MFCEMLSNVRKMAENKTKGKRGTTVKFNDTELLNQVQRNLPTDWFPSYKKVCSEKGLRPFTYAHANAIRRGVHINNDHFFILQVVAQARIERELAFKSLALKNKKLSEQLEAA